MKQDAEAILSELCRTAKNYGYSLSQDRSRSVRENLEEYNNAYHAMVLFLEAQERSIKYAERHADRLALMLRESTRELTSLKLENKALKLIK